MAALFYSLHLMLNHLSLDPWRGLLIVNFDNGTPTSHDIRCYKEVFLHQEKDQLLQ